MFVKKNVGASNEMHSETCLTKFKCWIKTSSKFLLSDLVKVSLNFDKNTTKLFTLSAVFVSKTAKLK